MTFSKVLTYLSALSRTIAVQQHENSHSVILWYYFFGWQAVKQLWHITNSEQERAWQNLMDKSERWQKMPYHFDNVSLAAYVVPRDNNCYSLRKDTRSVLVLHTNNCWNQITPITKLHTQASHADKCWCEKIKSAIKEWLGVLQFQEWTVESIV